MRTFLTRLFLLAALATALTTASAQSPSKFSNPTPETRPWVFWFWNNGNLTQEGIDADLEAMHRVGIGGVIIMEVGQGAPRGPVDYMGGRWRELFKHMVSKAASLGIKVNMNSGPGWNGSSGAWVAPENAMKVLSISVVEVPANNRPAKIVLPKGTVTFDYYKDICVLAFPTPKTKTGLEFLSVDKQHLATPAHQIPADAFIPLDAITDISDKMNPAGEVQLRDLPPGNWTLIRFGVTCKNKSTRPPLDSANGPECDKLSKRGIEAAFAGQMAKLIADNKPNAGAGKSLVATHVDSWENGSQTWTDDMRAEFLNRRKYDLWKFLPIFAGHVVQDAEHTERFLWDFRRTVSELALKNYAGRLKELAGKNGLRFTAEAYNHTPCDNLQYAGITDEPMGEFWTSGKWIHSCRGMASAGHIYGKTIIGAEAFTSGGSERWLKHPGTLKALGDQAFCEGINRLVFHRYSFQPWKNVRPGMMMGPFGIHYERTQTWWELTPAWHDYLSRCQYLLRQGQFAADTLYLEPEDSPQAFTEHPRNGFPWDQGNTDVILTARVENGNIVLPSGMSYRLLVLPPSNRMTEQLLEKTLQLVRDGATVIGNHRATQSPALTDYPNTDRRVQELAEKLWGDTTTTAPAAERNIGKGKFLHGTTPEDFFRATNIPPDFLSDIPLNWIHRRLPDAEIYFIANPRNHAVLANIQLRAPGQPELWNPETGKTTSAPAHQTDSSTTRLALPLGATESVFVILRKSPSRPNNEKLTHLSKDGTPLIDLTKVPGKITITSAKTAGLDVTPQVAALVDAGNRQITASRITGQQDTPLTITYELNGKQYTVTGRNGETLMLGNMLPPVKIQSATFGLLETKRRTADVTKKLQRYFDSGWNNFIVSSFTDPVDPAFGVRKSLKFTYEMNGKTATWNGNDKEMISLKSPDDDDSPAPPCKPAQDAATGKPCLDIHQPGNYEFTFASGKKRTEKISLPEAMNLDDNWTVAFPNKTVKFDKLKSWSESPDPSIKHHSGTATYTKTFTVPENLRQKNLRIVLDLGKAEMMAQIELNGKDLGLLWKIEKSVDITDLLAPGENRLKISVTNGWPNRLIGDAALPPSDERNANGSVKSWPQWLLDGKPDPNGRATFCMWNLWKKTDPLVPSGLIGPVRLVPVKRIITE